MSDQHGGGSPGVTIWFRNLGCFMLILSAFAVGLSLAALILVVVVADVLL